MISSGKSFCDTSELILTFQEKKLQFSSNFWFKSGPKHYKKNTKFMFDDCFQKSYHLLVKIVDFVFEPWGRVSNCGGIVSKLLEKYLPLLLILRTGEKSVGSVGEK